MPATVRRPRPRLAVAAVVVVGLSVVAAVRAVSGGDAPTADHPDPATARGHVLVDEPAATPYAAMWLWENPVHVSDDARGRGYAEADPEVVASFARTQGVSQVHVATPWAAHEGPVAAWLDDATAALREQSIEVSLLGGDPTWLQDPGLGAQWVHDAVGARAVDQVQLSLEPWAQPQWHVDQAGAVHQWHAAMDAVLTALPEGVELGIDAPAWLADIPSDAGGTLLDGVLARADSVAIVSFRDTAEGDDGIIAASTAARQQAGAAGVPYTVALETDSPRVTGGEEYTFFDDGAEVLDAQARVVDEALREHPGYTGISVERFRTWRDLVDPPAARYGGSAASSAA